MVSVVASTEGETADIGSSCVVVGIESIITFACLLVLVIFPAAAAAVGAVVDELFFLVCCWLPFPALIILMPYFPRSRSNFGHQASLSKL